ncbi:hypothetical protein ABPG72_007536 [Tetrahymena utriculariae]
MKQKKVIKLTPPTVKLEERIGQKAGLRPYRKGGVRLETEMYGDKKIVHNYGHGGGGVSVGFGYSLEAVEIFERETMVYPTNRNIAVLGSGYIGLYTAYILSRRGYTVTIYSDNFVSSSSLSQFDQTDSFPITSQVAGGIWIPSFYEYNNTPKIKLLHEKCARITYNFYKDCIENKKFKGLSYRTVYSVPSIQDVQSCTPKDIDMKYQNVLITFDEKHFIECYSYQTILADGDIFLPELISELDRLKVNFVKKHFDQKEDLFQLAESYVFNCTGLQSKFLFSDNNVFPVKGQLAVFKPNKDIEYFFIEDLPNGDRLVLFPLSVGLTYGHVASSDDYDNKPTKQVIDKISQNAYNYFKQFTQPNPSL